MIYSLRCPTCSTHHEFDERVLWPEGDFPHRSKPQQCAECRYWLVAVPQVFGDLKKEVLLTDIVTEQFSWPLPSSEKLKHIESHMESMRNALNVALPVLRVYASKNPMLHRVEGWVDPNGVHAAIEAIELSLGIRPPQTTAATDRGSQ